MPNGGNKIKKTLQKLTDIFNDFIKKEQSLEEQSRQIVARANTTAAKTDKQKITALKNKIKTS